MNFLKKHYEKVVLLAFFIVFAILLVHLYSIIQATGEVKESHLQIPTRDPDYEVTKRTDKKFDLDSIFNERISWEKIGSRDNATGKDYSDIMEIFKIVKCGHCEYLIPRSIMENSGKCMYCNKVLLPPKAEEEATFGARLDRDYDGIPDIDEIENKLNPYNADDALEDFDDDGFTNLCEYRMQTDLRDAKSHPALYNGLKLVRVERQQLKLNLLGVTIIKGSPKEGWSIQVETEEQVVNKKKRPKANHYLFIGSRIILDTGVYTISDIKVENVVKENDKKQKEVIEQGYIILKDRKQREITLKIGMKADDPEYKAVFADVWSDKVYTGKAGNRITMGSTEIGRARYVIKSITQHSNINNCFVTFEPLTKGGKEFVVRNKYALPDDSFFTKEMAAEKVKNKKSDTEASEASGADK